MGIELSTLRIDPRELLQHVSRVAYRGTPLYYGRDGTNRYDPECGQDEEHHRHHEVQC